MNDNIIQLLVNPRPAAVTIQKFTAHKCSVKTELQKDVL